MNLKKKVFVSLAIASTSTISFLVGKNFSNLNENEVVKRFLPLQIVSTTSSLVAPQPFNTLETTTTLEPKQNFDKTEIWKQPSRAAEIMKFGYPGYDNLRTYQDFVLSYDRRTRTAHWVVEHLSPDRMTYNPSVERSKCFFKPDASIHPYFRSLNTDYRKSGYDRGHLAAAGNHRKTQEAINQTFFLTNISPQVHKGFNADKWNDLEKHCRRLARKHPNVYICTGPLYLPQLERDGDLYVKYKVIGANRVAVPTHFFKVVLFEREDGNYELESYLLPNRAIPDEKPLSDFLVSLDIIERSGGFLIFEKMPLEKLRKINNQIVNEKSFLKKIF